MVCAWSWDDAQRRVLQRYTHRCYIYAFVLTRIHTYTHTENIKHTHTCPLLTQIHIHPPFVQSKSAVVSLCPNWQLPISLCKYTARTWMSPLRHGFLCKFCKIWWVDQFRFSLDVPPCMNKLYLVSKFDIRSIQLIRKTIPNIVFLIFVRHFNNVLLHQINLSLFKNLWI